MLNSFRIDFDAITGNLWDTENGVIFEDEINLIKPELGFMVIKSQTKKDVSPLNPHDLEAFDGRGKYQAPMFSWFRSVRPIGMAFFNSDKMGNHYKNDLFIGDIINGNIYHFDLNLQRTELLFPPGKLWDGVANSSDALDDIWKGVWW
jgi:aldose sugar dehydrogenase